jgi:hypothetical protein
MLDEAGSDECSSKRLRETRGDVESTLTRSEIIVTSNIRSSWSLMLPSSLIVLLRGVD